MAVGDKVRIDELTITSVPSLTHSLPAMKDGVAVRITPDQILGLLTGTDYAAKRDLSNATGPRGKLAHVQSSGLVNPDVLIENGFWWLDTAAPGNPAGAPVILEVEAAPQGVDYVTQYARAYAADGASDSKLWKRERNNGAWSAWYRIRENEAELDNRYLKRAGDTISGTNNFTGAVQYGGVQSVPIRGVSVFNDNTDFTRTSTTLGAMSAVWTYTPKSLDSFILMLCNVEWNITAAAATVDDYRCSLNFATYDSATGQYVDYLTRKVGDVNLGVNSATRGIDGVTSYGPINISGKRRADNGTITCRLNGAVDYSNGLTLTQGYVSCLFVEIGGSGYAAY